ncbi:Inositol-3-phosphate synthase [Entamoeba marina]
MQYQFKTPKTQITEDTITSDFHYETTHIEQTKDGLQIQIKQKAPKLGLMMIGWGGNNGTTVTASILANKHNLKWNTRTGEHEPNYYGSYTQSATMRIGATSDGKEIYAPYKEVLPFVNPNDVVIGGWDISKTNIADALKRAKVVEYDLQRQLYPLTQDMVPLPSVYYKSYIAANQDDRADNVLTGTKQENLNTLRQNIKDFKKTNQLDKVVVLWTATTERYVDIREGLNDTAENLLKSIEKGEEEVSPSTLFAVAAILEDCPFVNGSPQNTLVPGVIELANQHNGAVMGDDFKTGQTKIKSVLSDFLVSSGLKLQSIVSYNHLGNNDGKNLSSPSQFRSKEISKSNVVDDVVESNSIMYKEGEHPDHCVVIKYVPYVGDSKRAMDEYTSEIILGGHNTIAIHNTCEDSLLAAPLIIDLCILMEFMTRVTYSVDNLEFSSFNAVVSMISYLLKAPVVPKGAPVINALFKQRECLDNFFRALLGLPVDNHLLLEGKTKPFF